MRNKYMSYPSLFKLHYKNEFNNIDEYHLECLETLDLDLCKKTFKIDLSNNIIIDKKYITKLYSSLYNCFFGKFHYVGKSFSENKLSLGSIYNYYLQYLAQKIFNNSFLIEPFNNLQNLKKDIENNIEDIIHRFLNDDYHTLFNIKEILYTENSNRFLHFKCIINNNNELVNIKKTCWHIYVFLK